jgi:hypothetical protein
MDQIECPSDEVWQKRRKWFEDLFDIEQRLGIYLIGEQATGLLIDLQSVYCAGAFIACIILACTIVDSQLREVELESGFKGGFGTAFNISKFKNDLEWLRKRRNRLVHFENSKGIAISVDDHYDRRDEHENDAQKAIMLVAAVLFENPSI